MVIRRSACRANKWKCRERIEPWREKSRRSVRRRREGERGESINRGGNHSCGKQLLKNIPELGTRTIDGTNGVRSPIVDGGTRYLDSCYPPRLDERTLPRVAIVLERAYRHRQLLDHVSGVSGVSWQPWNQTP